MHADRDGGHELPLCIGIATRDRREIALGAVESVLPQLGESDELVVVDNGSTDGTADALAAVAKPYGTRFRVAVEPRGGASAARNRILAEARAEIVCFLDDDARARPGWLAALRAAWADATPRVAVIGGPIVPAFDGRPPAWLTGHLLHLVGALDLGDRRLVLDQSPGRGYVWGANMSVRVRPVLAIGGFDVDRGVRPEAPGDAGEEEELERRLVAAGHEVWYEPAARVRHIVPAASLTAAQLRREVRGRAQGEVRRGARRSSGVPVLLRATARCALSLLRARPAAAVAASIDATRGWTLVTEGRRGMRRARRSSAAAVEGASPR